MKNKVVSLIRCHVGIQVIGQVLTSIQADKHKCQLSLQPMGVLIEFEAGNCYIVPYANIHSIELK